MALGRRVNRHSGLSSLLVTTVSMGIGGAIRLAVVNTAVAFTLWNKSLRTLTAVESSIINNLMLPQIAILVWVFLGETLSARQIGGIVGVGTLIVQLGEQGLWEQQ
jgi:drug/metabolite transporter (DMT)-like permease